MKNVLTIDSSVFVSYFIKTEPRSSEASEILRPLFNNRAVVINPFTILIEVVAAIRRITRSEEKAEKVMYLLLNTRGLTFIGLDENRAKKQQK